MLIIRNLNSLAFNPGHICPLISIGSLLGLNCDVQD